MRVINKPPKARFSSDRGVLALLCWLHWEPVAGPPSGHRDFILSASLNKTDLLNFHWGSGGENEQRHGVEPGGIKSGISSHTRFPDR